MDLPRRDWSTDYAPFRMVFGSWHFEPAAITPGSFKKQQERGPTSKNNYARKLVWGTYVSPNQRQSL